MSWTRFGRYHRTSYREGRRVRTLYFGTGPGAAALAREHQAERAEQERLRREARDAEEAQRKQLAVEAARGEGLRLIVATCLEGYGYHRRVRHHWQRRRPVSQPQAPAPALAPPQPTQAEVDAEIKAAVAAIRQAPDPVAVARLRELARQYPKTTARIVGMDLARLARYWIDEKLTDKKKDKDKGGLMARMEVMTAELSGENPSIGVLMAAELAAYNWMETWLLNTVCSNDFDGAGARTSKRRTAAQLRFLKSLKVLEQLKALEGKGPIINVIT
jgi:hypothetical protein